MIEPNKDCLKHLKLILADKRYVDSPIKKWGYLVSDIAHKISLCEETMRMYKGKTPYKFLEKLGRNTFSSREVPKEFLDLLIKALGEQFQKKKEQG